MISRHDINNDKSSVEAVLLLIEKMANSEGIFRRLKQGDLGNTIKANLLEKKDILEPFKNKYDWYFKAKYGNNNVQKRNFDDIMDMTSIYTESSQLSFA